MKDNKYAKFLKFWNMCKNSTSRNIYIFNCHIKNEKGLKMNFVQFKKLEKEQSIQRQ